MSSVDMKSSSAGGGSGGAGAGSRLSKKLGKLNLSEETEMTLRRIQDSKNVIGVVVVNREGMPVMSSLDSTLTVQVRVKRKRKMSNYKYVMFDAKICLIFLVCQSDQ